MNARRDGVGRYAHLWQDGSSYPHRWVIWTTAAETMVFDRADNRPVDIDGEEALREVLRRMREAGAPECDTYPGRPCA
ncbi:MULTISPECIES: hypothetical protein [Streptomyces]|uniref:Uncharacterized protein n=1 Tax=Streptomyces lycii TaxID=2654337 RepID=A0ABQ7FDD6_9ACTN|nr:MULTISPECIES: hypothetical protein [Streptomyces]KAF4406872.1 hypothetical protein GCU69_22725 [Streptomyces lycii]